MKESVTYQEIFEEGEIKGKMEGKQEEKQKIAINLLRQSLSVDFIAMVTGLSQETVQELQQNLA
jgi:predicted transposase/invertase (TIGR01784 family)